jgi:hypothetical protein
VTGRLVAPPGSSWVDDHDLILGSEKGDHVLEEPRVRSEARDQYDRRPVPVDLVVERDVTDLGVRHSRLSTSNYPRTPVPENDLAPVSAGTTKTLTELLGAFTAPGLSVSVVPAPPASLCRRNTA